MDPSILDLSENTKNNTLSFTLSNINVSMANAIRRVMLSDIPTVVFRTFPHENNDATFHINTSRLNNEILKQRLSCIPINITDFDIDLKEYLLELDVTNNTENMIYVTTADFKILNTTTNKYLSDDILNDIFKPDSISKQFIDFCRLRPKISDNTPGEKIKMTCKFSKGTASENGSFNVVSTASYNNTIDPIKVNDAKEIKLAEFKEKYDDETEIQNHLNDWLNLDAKRIFVPNSFDFIVQSIGVFDNKTIVQKAINILIDRLKKIITIYSGQTNLIINSDTTIPHSFDIILENEDYTIGKIIEYMLYKLNYVDNKSLTFCGFRKPHPHINKSIIRIAFNKETDKNTVVQYLIIAVNSAIDYYKKILPQVGEFLVDDTVISKPTTKSDKEDLDEEEN